MLLLFSLLILIMNDDEEKQIGAGLSWGLPLKPGTTYKFFMYAGTGMTANIFIGVNEEDIEYFPKTIYVYEYSERPFVSYNCRSSANFSKTLEDYYYSNEISYSPVKGTTNFVVFEVIINYSIYVSVKGYASGSYTPLTIDYNLINGISGTIKKYQLQIYINFIFQ